MPSWVIKAAILLLALLLLAFAVLAGPVDDLDEPTAPSANMALYRGADIELRYPENWLVGENSGFTYVNPVGGFVDGLLAYGMMIGTFDPQYDVTLEDAADQVVAQYRLWNQNISMVRYAGTTRVNGLDAMVFDLLNVSPTPAHGMETDTLVVVLRPNGLVTYFAAVTPEADSRDYKPAFKRILASVHFLS